MTLAGFLHWRHFLFAIESLLVVVCLFWPLRWARAERLFGRLALQWWSPLAVGVFALVLRALALPITGIPQPSIHDEFSYLLAADTFSHGRLTNLTHPMWEFFETFHVDQLPTYASMYPPVQGLALAAGRVLTGSAFGGVWLSVGLMCAALTWALRGWLPARWALLGGIIAAIRLAMFSYWGDSYWGGALAAAGGALLVGALPRLIRWSRGRDAAIAAIGIGMLAGTRQYEGLVLTVGVTAIAVWQIRRIRLRRIMLPGGVVLLCVIACLGYYNWRVFGSATTLPYTLNRETYAVAPIFLFQSLHPEPFYRHQVMQKFFTGFEVGVFQSALTLPGYIDTMWQKLIASWSFYLGPLLTLPFLAGLASWRNRKTRQFLFLTGCLVLGGALIPFYVPHYIAPLTVAIYALVLQGLRMLQRRFAGVARAVPGICVAMVGVRMILAAAAVPVAPGWPHTWARIWPAPMGRENFVEQLRARGGQHLVLVRYAPERPSGSEFVYNDADIDASPIVWAHDMGNAKNPVILRYFNLRTAWLLDVDEAGHARLSPYPGTQP